ncbi:FtsK/SpoIIIE domain-containing protein [Streptomyces prunicolor]|uniref:FtsK/SpoIIIE domain-containing protein n=1 Tax=Streptomyces prunicolor TaxID=67348 RepID=UPI00386FD04B|nr:FtsK/SpoIIIE domain-containing protein [Streptomyces prunicolor]
MWFTWRRLCQNTDLAVVRRPRYTMVGRDTMVRGMALRPVPPRLGVPKINRIGCGLSVRVRLHPGQTPAQFIAVTEAIIHTWRVHSVRVISPERGEVLIVATARDPLAGDPVRRMYPARRFMAAVVGRTGDGSAWTIDLRKVPHWLVVGATQSGKSTLLAAFVTHLGAQPVALVGIDCKGGMEFSLFAQRLSALATNRREAIGLLNAMISEAESRMAMCRAAGVRSVWGLGDDERPVPIVVLVDEIAELYLGGATLAGRKEAVECSTALLRLAQLGAALGIHLVVAAQRFGSELGPGVTALRAQLGGRICHRVNDEASAEMALGDLSPDAIAVAQAITEDEKGVAVTTVGGHWVRARSMLLSPDEVRHYASLNAHRTPELPALAAALEAGGQSHE